MKLTGKLTTLLVAFFATFSSFAQTCGLTPEIITICDMASIDFDGDGNSDGIINLYDEFFNATGITLDTGIWSIENSLSLPLNETTGEVALWQYVNSSVSSLVNYEFTLFTTTCSDINNPAATIIIELGSFSGVALPPSGTNDINFETCDGTVDIYQALVSNEVIPSPHLNGLWELLDSPTNGTAEVSAENNIWFFDIDYQPGLPLIDKGEFVFKYTVPATSNCPAQETTVKISVVRQVNAGNNNGAIPNIIEISENDIINGLYDAPIDLRDDIYLAGEDEEGYWTGNPNLNPDDRTDSVINIKEIYDNFIATNNPIYDTFSETFTHNVDKRSGVCSDNSANIIFVIVQELQPFVSQIGGSGIDGSCFSVCLNDNEFVNLFEYIDFTEADGFTFEYNNDRYVNWRYNRKAGSEVETADFGLREQPDFLSDFDSSIDYHLGTISFQNVPPGEYEFEYAVSSNILNPSPDAFCDPYDSILEANFCNDPFARVIQTATICIVVEDYDYAGEDVEDIEICENEESVILTSYLETLELLGEVATTGIWTDVNGIVYDNEFEITAVDTDTEFELTYTTTHPTSGCVDSSVLKFKIINEVPLGSTGEINSADEFVRVCSNDLNVNLFDFLQNADTNGQWTGPAGYVSEDYLGEFIFNDTTLPRLIQGEYVYTIGDGENCTSMESTAIIIEFVDPVILANGVNRFYCLEDVSIDLATLLEVSAPTDGVFTDLDNTGNLTGSVFTFATVGQFNFRYTLDVSPCELATQDFVIQVLDGSVAPSAGIQPVDPIKVCADNLTINLFDQLGGTPSQSGTWTGPFTYQSIDHVGQFEHNNETLPILGPGEYTYTVGGGACNAPFASQTVTIEIEEPIVLGDDINRSFCKLSGSTNLFSLLDQNSVITGQFTDTDMTEALSADGSLDFSNLSTGTYNFKYSIPNNAPCLESSLNVSINIFETPVPTEADKDFCILDAKRLEDIKVYYFRPSEVEGEEPIRVELDSDVTNWYASLQSDQPITDNPVLIDEAIYYVTNVSDVDGEECESERFEVQVNILNVGEQIIIDNTLTVKCPLEFQDGVSADGNGINDTFSLKWKDDAYDIEAAFPDYKLEIYNRYGVIVYKGNPSTDEFNGNSNVSLSIGSDLPSGVYFYIFNPNFKNNKPVQGSFYLSK